MRGVTRAKRCGKRASSLWARSRGVRPRQALFCPRAVFRGLRRCKGEDHGTRPVSFYTGGSAQKNRGPTTCGARAGTSVSVEDAALEKSRRRPVTDTQPEARKKKGERRKTE